jgi:hypothetical protein
VEVCYAECAVWQEMLSVRLIKNANIFLTELVSSTVKKGVSQHSKGSRSTVDDNAFRAVICALVDPNIASDRQILTVCTCNC